MMASNPWQEGIEAIVLRTVNDQLSLWDAILPAELLVLPDELARVDALLDDPVFFTPFVAYFDPRIGRPSVPMETYLRMMFLKFRYRLGFEALCREVGDSISWQRFCRIPLGSRVPHPTTLMKLTRRCGEAAVTGLNDALLAKAAAQKLLRTDKVRADTTVVEAAVAYPTDSGLLAKAVGGIAGTIKRIQAAGGATRTRVRDRSRSAGQRARSIASKLRLRGAAAREEGQAANERLAPPPRSRRKPKDWYDIALVLLNNEYGDALAAAGRVREVLGDPTGTIRTQLQDLQANLADSSAQGTSAYVNQITSDHPRSTRAPQPRMRSWPSGCSLTGCSAFDAAEDHWPSSAVKNLGRGGERLKCGVESPLAAAVGLMVSLSRHEPDQLVEVIIGGSQDSAVVVGADPEHQSLAVGVKQP